MYTYRAKLIRWVDGDTLLVLIDLGFYTFREERIRLARINAPEMNGSSTYVRRKAKHARAVGKKLCPHNSTIVIQTRKTKRDMYARYIAEVTYNGKNLSDALLQTEAVQHI